MPNSNEVLKLIERPMPSMQISYNGFDAEQHLRIEISTFINSITKQFDGSGLDFDKLNIILLSYVTKLAEDISMKEAGVTEKSGKYYELAFQELKNRLEINEEQLRYIYEYWLKSAEDFMRETKKSHSLEDSVFLLCEQYRIDLIDFQKHFSSLLRQ